MSGTTLWVGPVSAQQTQGAAWPNTKPVHWTCTGDGHPSCADIAALVQRGERQWPADPLWGAAFSAGGHFWRRVLEDPAVRGRLKGLYLADATYTTERRGGAAAPIEGFVLWGLEAFASNKPFYATGSSAPNKTHPTGAETLWAIVDELARRGIRWTDVAQEIPGAARAVQAGSLLLIDYGARYAHAAHATEVAPRALRAAEPDDARAAEPKVEDRAREAVREVRDGLERVVGTGGGIVATALLGGALVKGILNRRRRNGR